MAIRVLIFDPLNRSDSAESLMAEQLAFHEEVRRSLQRGVIYADHRATVLNSGYNEIHPKTRAEWRNHMKTRASRRTATSANAFRGGIVPIGGLLLYAGETVPTGLLMCDGRAISRHDYPQLFEVIGTTFGNGDGTTTFNLPNLASPASGLHYVVRSGSSPDQLAAANDW